MEEGINLVPLHLQHWKDSEVVWNPFDDGKEDEGEILIWYVLEDGTRIPIAAKGEVMGITGREKSRKTLFAQCMVMSKHVTDRNITMGYVIRPDALIYHFDTEQPKRRTKKNLKRFYEICGTDGPDPNYKVFNIKKYSHTQKLEIITHIIEELFEDIGRYPDIIIVDQIGDLVPARDVNDQLGADNVLNHVILWGEMTNALFMPILHTNRGGKETNGKLGALFDKKCDSMYITDINEENVTTVTHKLARDRKSPQFTFRQDFSGIPRLLKVMDSPFND